MDKTLEQILQALITLIREKEQLIEVVRQLQAKLDAKEPDAKVQSS